jgi:hypothetical protein
VKLGQEMVEKDYIQIKSGSSRILIVLLIILSGCAGNHGRLSRNSEANKIFNSYQILPDHRYYYSGPDGRPDAIMGIQGDYTLETSMWTEFDPFDDTLKKGVNWINFHHHSRARRYPYGFDIVGPDGKRIGIWYSIWEWTTVLVEADKRVKIFPPAMEESIGPGDEPDRMDMD